MPPTSVLRSRQPLVLTLLPGAGLPAAAAAPPRTTPLTRCREAAVVRAHLPVRQVDLETEHGLDPADRELEVRTEPGAPVPLTVAVTGQVAVVRCSGPST